MVKLLAFYFKVIRNKTPILYFPFVTIETMGDPISLFSFQMCLPSFLWSINIPKFSKCKSIAKLIDWRRQCNGERARQNFPAKIPQPTTKRAKYHPAKIAKIRQKSPKSPKFSPFQWVENGIKRNSIFEKETPDLTLKKKHAKDEIFRTMEGGGGEPRERGKKKYFKQTLKIHKSTNFASFVRT